MLKGIIFENPGLLSLIDITTMGDSSKINDSSKIGKFDSGLKYAIALLYRNKIDFEIWSGSTRFIVTTTVLTDKTTNKAKEVMVIVEENLLEEPTDAICESCNKLYNLNSGPGVVCEGARCSEMLEDTPEIIQHITGFSPKLGYNWELWHAIRELYANMLDEDGTIKIISSNVENVFGNENKTSFIIYPNQLITEIIENQDIPQ